jgi:hypothetical protein
MFKNFPIRKESERLAQKVRIRSKKNVKKGAKLTNGAIWNESFAFISIWVVYLLYQ